MSERDKWGRIPAKLIEIDQDFCANNWGESPCRAGPQANYVPYSSDLTDAFWNNTGTTIDDGGRDGLSDAVDIQRSTVDIISISSTGLTDPETPVFTTEKDLYLIVEFEHQSGDANFRVELTLYGEGNPIAQPAIIIRSVDQSIVSTDPGVFDEQITNIGGSWYQLKFGINTTTEIGNDETAYIPYPSISASGGAADGVCRFSLLQITENLDDTYFRTLGEIKVASDSPCFNTLSSCQATETYFIEGQLDALSLGSSSANQNVYTGDFEGLRDEGIYLEFFVNQRTAASADHAAQTIVDIDGILTASVIYDAGTSSNSRIEFSVDGASVEYELLGSLETTYRVAAFVSRSGTLTVRGVDGTAAGNPFSATPSTITVQGVDSATTGEFYIADVLVYDYQARQLNLDPRLNELRQKGDVFGDALFYVRYIRSKGVTSASGIVPSPSDLTEVDEFGFDVTSSSPQLTLYDFSGNTDLLEPPLILRFTERNKSSRLPEILRAIPSLNSAQNKAGQLQVGGTNENISALGSRDELTANFEDHPYSDYLVDPYRDQRTYTPEEQGTFWGKWMARNVYRKGFDVRYVTGYELPTGGFERVHSYSYFLDKVNGPTAKGKVSLKAFDILQSLRADKAVYPAASTGFLAADISDTDTSFTLDPVGIGDEEYPSSFRCRIGGEGFDVTRTGDTCSISTRGLYGGAESHAAEDSVQVVGQIDAEQIHDAAYIIITTALPELEGYIPKSKWDGLADDFLPRLYTADITEPTGVEDLLGELVSIAPIYFYTDIRTNLIELGVIREPSSAAIELTEDQELIADTVDLKEYPKERIDEVWVYYRIRDAAGDIDDQENYSQRFILVNPEEQARRGERSIKRIYSRWLEGGGARDTAEEVAQAYISRFQNTPIRVSFDLDAREGDIWLGDVAKLITRQKQTITGENESDLNYQIIQAHEPEAGHAFQYIAQSYEFFSPVDPDKITITILPEDNLDGTGAVDQIDLRELYDATVATQIDDITFVVAGGPQPSGGTVVGAGDGQTWSLNNPSDWPWSPTIELRIESGGVVAGRAGAGGSGGGESQGIDGEDGSDGQTALRVRYATSVNNLGIIGGGGGGAGGGGAVFTSLRGGEFIYGGAGGGGGAGKISIGGSGGIAPSPSDPNGQPGSPGEFTEGGDGGQNSITSGGVKGGNGGTGGGLGQSGGQGQDGQSPLADTTFGSGGAGGAPGLAIDGISNVTFITRGDIRGNTT